MACHVPATRPGEAILRVGAEGRAWSAGLRGGASTRHSQYPGPEPEVAPGGLARLAWP